MHKARFINHSYPDSLNIQEAQQQIKQAFELKFKEFNSKFQKISKYRVMSDGTKKIDPSVYVGSGGVSIAYYKTLMYLITTNAHQSEIDDVQAKFETSLKHNIQLAESGESSIGTIPSFYMGAAGLYTLGARHYKQKDHKIFEKMISKLYDAYSLCFDEGNAEYEVLYGGAGYLYCLLSVMHYCGHFENMKEYIRKVIDEIITAGKQWSQRNDYFLTKWPKDKERGKYYLGGAHGLLGVLQMILQSVLMVPDFKKDQALMEIVKNTCEYALEQQLPNGGFPSSLGKKDDPLVHFCHGAPGAIPMLVSAFKVFKDQKYMDAALKAGEVVWNRGLLLKGNGLCHGIAGNAYFLHSLYRATNDDKWRHRAYSFCLATFDPDIQDKCADNQDPTRLKTGVADNPYSLMQGMAGELCLYADFLSLDTKGVRFPGYEV